MHPECIEIAKRVIAYNLRVGSSGPKSLRELVEMYWERLENTIANHNTMGPLNYLDEPNEYYGYGGSLHTMPFDDYLSDEGKVALLPLPNTLATVLIENRGISRPAHCPLKILLAS